MTKLMTETVLRKRILVITNDSTVFKDKARLLSAWEMFEGRMTEVKHLVARLDTAKNEKGNKLCDVSFGVISTRYGFVPGNYMVTGYDEVMDSKEGYERCQAEKQYVETVSYLTQPFDLVIFCIPKEMFRLFLDADQIRDGCVVAVTSPEFKERVEAKDWYFLERSGARVGDKNAEEIERIVRQICA